MTGAALGSAAFRARHGVRLAYMAGAMAHGIASVPLVEALAGAGLLGSFGAAGLTLAEVEAAVARLCASLGPDRFCVNLIHAPDDPGHEVALVRMLLRHGVRTIEASAFIEPGPAVALFRAHGAASGRPGRVVGKVSRREVAAGFLRPPAAAVLQGLVAEGFLSAADAAAAAGLPLASDVTVEADSGGHTDNQPLVCAWPAIAALRAQMAVGWPVVGQVGVGAAGGLGTPHALVAAFAMGADYVVTGSVNQACVEAGTSDAVKQLLADATIGDTAMAPAADMFEQGARVQVLQRGTMFARRSQRLFEAWRAYPSIEALPAELVAQLEAQVFRRTLAEAWVETEAFWAARQPERLVAAAADPKLRMALLFRSYLGLSSDWARRADASRAIDYQVWCGPAMAAFNLWAADGPLAAPAARRVAGVAEALMQGAAAIISPPAAAPVAAPSPERLPAPIVAASWGSDAVRAWLIAEVARECGMTADDVDSREPLASFAIDSVRALLMLRRLEGHLGETLSPTLLFSYPSIDAMAGRLGR